MDDYQELRSYGIDVKVAIRAEYMSATGEVSSGTKMTQAQKMALYNTYTQTFESYVGARPPADGNLRAWISDTQAKSPAPLTFELKYIADLFTRRYFEDAKEYPKENLEQMRDSFELALNQIAKTKPKVPISDKPLPTPPPRPPPSPLLASAATLRNVLTKEYIRATADGKSVYLVPQGESYHGDWVRFSILKAVASDGYILQNVFTKRYLRATGTQTTVQLVPEGQSYHGDWIVWNIINSKTGNGYVLRNVQTKRYLRAEPNKTLSLRPEDESYHGDWVRFYIDK